MRDQNVYYVTQHPHVFLWTRNTLLLSDNISLPNIHTKKQEIKDGLDKYTFFNHFDRIQNVFEDLAKKNWISHEIILVVYNRRVKKVAGSSVPSTSIFGLPMVFLITCMTSGWDLYEEVWARA